MDSEPGRCWRCGEPAQGSCPRCQLALYCSTTCLQDDRAAHLSECDEADTAELPCANCGRQSRHLSRCARCHLAAYCSTECGDLHSRLHLPACLAGRDAVLRLANQLTHAAEPFRLPVYFGDGVHALNLLKQTDQTGEEPCQLLQLSAQLQHLLRTAAGVSDSRRPLLVTLASDSGHQLARAYLLLYLLARGAGPAATVQVMYSLRLTAEHARLLQAALEQLVTATYSQLLQLVPWVRIGRAALSHWQEVWRAWLNAMQDARCLERLERCRDAAMAEPNTAKRLEHYLAALPEEQQQAARDFLLGHGTLMGDRQRRAAADSANVTLLALNPRDQRHREAFSDLRLGSDPPGWLEAAAGADTVLAPPPAPAGALADWDRAEVARALGADVDPADGCRRLAEDCAEAAEARVAAGRLSVRLVQFTSLSELDEQLAELRFERVFTADATDRLGLFDVLEMAEVLLAPVPHALIVTSHSRWAALTASTGMALSALRGGGSMAWDRQMDTERFRLQTYLQGERLAYAARARHKDVLDTSLRVPTVPEVTSFGTMLMTNFSRRLQVAVPHKFRPERRFVSNSDRAVRFLEWRRDPEGVRKRIAGQYRPAETAAAAAPASAGAGDTPRPPIHRGPGLYERHLQSPTPGGDTAPAYGSIRRSAGFERRPVRSGEPRADPRPEHRSSLQADLRQGSGRQPRSNSEDVPDRRPDRSHSDRRPRRPVSAPLVRVESLPVAQRRRQESHEFQPALETPLYENPAAARAAARQAEREALARQAPAREAAPREARSLVPQQVVPERPWSGMERPQRLPSRRRTIEIGPASRPAQPPQTEQFRRTASLRVGRNQTPAERLRAPPVSAERAGQRAERPSARSRPATPPRSLEGMFPSLRSSLSPPGNMYANVPAREQVYAVPEASGRVAQHEQIYDVPQHIIRAAPRHQQSSVGPSGSPQLALSPNGATYLVYGAQDRPRSPGTDSLGSQHDSPLSASHYSALQTPEGRRRLTNIFTYPSTRPERSASVSSARSTSRESSVTPPNLPVKRSATARPRMTEQPPFSGAPLTVPRQTNEPRRPHQPVRGYPDASLTLPRQGSEGLRARQLDRSATLPRQFSEPLRPFQPEQRAAQRPRTYGGAPVPLPRRSGGAPRRSEYDDYAVPQPRPRQLGGTSLGQQSVSGSEDTLVSSSTAEDDNTTVGPAPVKTTTEPHEPEASPADIDRLTQWREPKSISDWLRQDRTRQGEFDCRSQSTAGDPRWTRTELAPLPATSSPPTRPGRIAPSSASSATLASTSTAAEKRHAFLRNSETTGRKLMRSLEDGESASWTKRPSSTDTATSEEHSSHSVTSPLHGAPHSEGTISLRRDVPLSGGAFSPKEDLRRSGDTPLSTESLPHGRDEPQTIAELGLRDTAAAWVLEQCLQEVLSEEREALRAQLVGWLEKKIADEMLFTEEALKEAKAASTSASTEGGQTTPEPTAASRKPASDDTTPEDLNAEVPTSEISDTAAKKNATPDVKGADAAAKKGDLKADHLPVPKSAAPPKLNQNSSSPFDVNSEEASKLGSPRFPVIDTPAPKSMPREKFFADMFQYKSPRTGERLVTLRLDATTEAPPSPGEENPARTPFFSSSVIIPSPEQGLAVPQRIVIDVVAEPETVQPPAIRLPPQPAVETEVKSRVLPTTPPIATVTSFSGDQPEKEREGSSAARVATPPTTNAAPPAAIVVAVTSGESATSDHPPMIREKADIETAAVPFTRPHSPPTRRQAIKPLSLLNPDNIGRPFIAPSGHIHRSPVEEPYPLPGDDLSSRRARLEARNAARESSLASTDQSGHSDSSPDQPQPPSSPSNLGATDSAGEASQSAVFSGQEDGSCGDPSAVEQLERDECESERGEVQSGSENANTSATYRSSLHIPMEQTQEDSGNSQLQEILIKFPLITFDSGEQEAGRPDVTVTSPRREVAAVPIEQSVTQTPVFQTDVTAEHVEEDVEQSPDDRADTFVAPSEPDAAQNRTRQAEDSVSPNAGKTLQLTREEPMAMPSEHHPVEEADAGESDHSTPPPLPLSPPPKWAVQPPLAMHGDVTLVEIGAQEAKVGANEAAGGAAATETDLVVAKGGGQEATDPGEAAVDTDAVKVKIDAVKSVDDAEATEGNAMAAEEATDPNAAAADTDAMETKTDAVETVDGAEATKGNAVVAESSEVETKSGAEAMVGDTGTKDDEKPAEDVKRVAEGSTDVANSSVPVLRRHSVSDKQSQRLGNLVRRRRSRKMSMDKEYHDMKRKLTVTNAGLGSRHDTELGEDCSQSRTDGTHPITGPASRSTLDEGNRGTEGAPSTRPADTGDGARHPGSLAKARRKSRPLSMDAEYYAMKSKLQIHNGHPKGHGTGDSAGDDAQRQSAVTQPSDHAAGHRKPPASGEHRTAPSSGTAPGSTNQTPATAAHRRSSGRLTMDKEFFAMRAQLTLHSSGHHGSVPGRPPPASSVPGFEPEDPPSPPPSPVSGLPPTGPQPRCGRRTSVEEEFFAARAAHLARHPVQPDLEDQSPPGSPKVQTHSLAEERRNNVPQQRPEPGASADGSVVITSSAATASPQIKMTSASVIPKKPAPVPSSTSETPAPAQVYKSPAPAPPSSIAQGSSPAPPTTSPKPSPASQITPTPGHPTTSTAASSDRRNIRPLPLDLELLASRAQLERPPTGSVPQLPPASLATPPPSPTSVLSRTGRPGSIRKRVQQLERSATEGETPRSPQQQSAPAPFSRTNRPGSVRDRIRRMEMLQQGQSAAAEEETGKAAAEESPVTLRKHSTHSPFTRLGSGDGGGVSSLTVRLQSSPTAAAQRGSLSPTGPQPPPTAAAQRGSLSPTGPQPSLSAAAQRGSLSPTGPQPSPSGPTQRGSLSPTGPQPPPTGAAQRGSLSPTGPQPSPSVAAQRVSLSPTGPQPPAPVQRGEARQRHSLPTGTPWSGCGSANIPETTARKTSDDLSKIPGQLPENGDDASEGVPSTTESKLPASENKAESSSAPEAAKPSQVMPPKPAARRAPENTPSPPDLLTWPWTSDDDDVEAKHAEQAEQTICDISSVRSSPELPKASSRSGNSSLSAYETANESSFSPRASLGEPRQLEEAAAPAVAPVGAISESQEASSGTEIDAQDDDVFTDAGGALASATVTSL